MCPQSEGTCPQSGGTSPRAPWALLSPLGPGDCRQAADLWGMAFTTQSLRPNGGRMTPFRSDWTFFWCPDTTFSCVKRPHSLAGRHHIVLWGHTFPCGFHTDTGLAGVGRGAEGDGAWESLEARALLPPAQSRYPVLREDHRRRIATGRRLAP